MWHRLNRVPRLDCPPYLHMCGSVPLAAGGDFSNHRPMRAHVVAAFCSPYVIHMFRYRPVPRRPPDAGPNTHLVCGKRYSLKWHSRDTTTNNKRDELQLRAELEMTLIVHEHDALPTAQITSIPSEQPALWCRIFACAMARAHVSHGIDAETAHNAAI